MGKKNENNKHKKKLTTKEKKALNHAKLMEFKGKGSSSVTFHQENADDHKKAA
jgi:hypothetical protein